MHLMRFWHTKINEISIQYQGITGNQNLKKHFYNHSSHNEIFKNKLNKICTGCILEKIKELKNRRDMSCS